MVEKVRGTNHDFCQSLGARNKFLACNTLEQGTHRDFLTTFATLLALVIVRVVLVALIFGYGFLPVYYLWFPLMAILEISLLIAEAVILFRRTGLFVIVMLLHLLVFIPVIGIVAFIPWSLGGLLLYGLLHGTK